MERSERTLTLDEVVEGIIYGAQDLGIGIGTQQSYHALLEIIRGLELLYGFAPYTTTGLPMAQFIHQGLLNTLQH